MASLAESVIGGAQTQVQGQGQSVGNAVQAYHIAATTENARQELEMEKTNHEMNKANFVLQGITKANSLTGPLQKQYIDSFGKSWQRMDPSADVSGLQSLQRSPEDLKKYLDAYSTMAKVGGVQNQDQANYIAQSGSLEGAQKLIDDHEAHQALIQAAQYKSEGMNVRGEVMKANAQQSAADKFDKDPNIVKLIPMGQSLGRDLSTLTHNSAKHPVTYQTLHESLMNVAAVLGGGSLSDSRVNSITPHVSDELRTKIESYFGNDPNQAADPKYVDYVRNLVTRLHGAVKSDVADRAKQIGQGRDTALADKLGVGDVIRAKQTHYETGQWLQNQTDAASSQGSAGPSAADFAHMTDAEVAAAYAKHKAGGQ